MKPSRRTGSGAAVALQGPAGTSVAPPEYAHTEITASPVAEAAKNQPTMLQRVGLALLLVSFVSGALNDFFIRAGFNPHIYTATLMLFPIVLLISGGLIRGLTHRIGWYWLALLGCMLLSTPFSVWRTGSVVFLMSYIPRAYLLFFYVSAFVVTVENLRRFVYALLISDLLLLASCWLYGAAVADRFSIPESIFYGNANELALALVIAITQFVYILYGGKMLTRLIAAVAVLIAVNFMLKTGSRGCFLALIVCALTVLWTSKNKLIIAAVMLVVFCVAIIRVPSQALHRLTLFTFTSDAADWSNADDESSLASQLQREQLLRRSILVTLRNPVIGVGPNQFVVADSGAKNKNGQWADWLGTHNSYTQVSSECGIPALFLYLGVLFGSTRLAYKLYRRTRESVDPEIKEIKALAFMLLLGLVVYAVGTTFFHMAYTSSLPILAGMAVSLELAAKEILPPEEPKGNAGLATAAA